MNSMDILEGWPIDLGNDTCVCISKHRKSGSNLLEHVGPGHDVDDLVW